MNWEKTSLHGTEQHALNNNLFKKWNAVVEKRQVMRPTIKCFYGSVWGLWYKLGTIRYVISQSRSEITVLSERWLSTDIIDEEVSMEDMTLSTVRETGGRVAAYINNNFKDSVPQSSSNTVPHVFLLAKVANIRSHFLLRQLDVITPELFPILFKTYYRSHYEMQNVVAHFVTRDINLMDQVETKNEVS